MKRLLMKWVQPFKFAIVGAINTGSSLLIYYLLLFFHLNYMFATVVAYIGSSIIGYFINRTWVFQVKKAKIHNSILKYYVVYGTSLVINLACMYLWVHILTISKTIAPVLTMCVTIPFNYLFSKFWIFKEFKEKEESIK